MPSALLEHQPAMDEVLQFQKDRGDFDAAYAIWDATSREYLGSFVSGQPTTPSRRRCTWRHGAGSLPGGPHPHAPRRRLGAYLHRRDRLPRCPGSAAPERETRWRSLTHLSSDWFWERMLTCALCAWKAARDRVSRCPMEDHYGLDTLGTARCRGEA